MSVAGDAMKLKIAGLDEKDFSRMIGDLGITEKRASAAYRRAVDKTMTWLARLARKDISGAMGIPVKALRHRLMQYRTTRSLMRAKVWFGLKTLDATRAGKGRQLKSGVRVKSKYFFPGAFRAAVFNSDEKIWVRRSSKHYDPNVYPAERGKPDSSGFVSKSGGRFPLIKARIDLEEAEDIFTQWVARAEARLSQAIHEELAKELVRSARA